jgi:hypothetical protein
MIGTCNLLGFIMRSVIAGITALFSGFFCFFFSRFFLMRLAVNSWEAPALFIRPAVWA